MNWKQFKESVEKQGVTDEMKLHYIETEGGIITYISNASDIKIDFNNDKTQFDIDIGYWRGDCP